jgi:asparagine synthase (glutamine-hydrolysing)
MISDVPIGAFLSGGIDSSTVVSIMQAQHPQPIRTFTIGFYEPTYNEAEAAKAIANHLGTEHTELYIGEQDLLNALPEMPRFFDEPFADSSQLPTYLVSRLTRQHVTVCLSGDGGDELFCGYNRYHVSMRLMKKLQPLPGPLLRTLSAVLLSVPEPAWQRIFSRVPSSIDKPSERLQKLGMALSNGDVTGLYEQLMRHWDPKTTVRGAPDLPPLYADRFFGDHSDMAQRAMFRDQEIYLPDDNLTKVDRASMAVALEARVPLLDHRVVEFAARLPLHMKLRDGKTKWLLRQVLARYVPPALTERPKMGFSVPIGVWLRGPLRDWAESLLDERRLREQGFFEPAPIRARWKEHLSGAHNWQHLLWDILMFQAWHDAYIRD